MIVAFVSNITLEIIRGDELGFRATVVETAGVPMTTPWAYQKNRLFDGTAVTFAFPFFIKTGFAAKTFFLALLVLQEQ